MRIIVSTHDLLAPVIGGGALRTIKTAEEFKKIGHEVLIIAPTAGIGEVSGIKTHWLHPPRKQRSQILSSIKFNIRLLRKFLQFARKTDMFFVHNTIAAAVIPFIKPIFKFRYVLDITDLHGEYLPVGKRNFLERIVTPLILWIEYWIINNADKIIVATEAMKKHVISKGINPEKIRVVYDAAEIEEISFEKEPGFRKNVIHLGSVDRQHNVEVFIKAIPEVLKRHKDAKFFIVGGGRELKNIIALSKKLEVYSSCIFTDYLPCPEARKYLKNAMIGVIPRNDNLPNRIITTLKIYEYWASKTAVISSRTAGIEEIARENIDVLFFTSGNYKELAAKISFLIENPQIADKIREEGYKTTQKYTWKNTTPLIAKYAFE